MTDVVKDNNSAKFEQSIVNKLVKEILQEHKRSRRWGIFFKLILFGYLFSILIIYLIGISGSPSGFKVKHTALVEIKGVIAADEQANADYIVTSLRNAFKNKNTKGVIIRINSPGGSPVQSAYINDEIKRLRTEYPDIPLYTVISDICASGGYYIAVAADKIYANKASIVGSIGVIMNGFGFVEAIDKLGIKRRLMHAGENKGIMDPFQPVKEEEKKHIQGLLDNIHKQFIDVVKEGRGNRLIDDEKIFSGLIWTGEEGVKLGLVDELASASQVAKDIIGAEKIVDFTKRENYLEQFANQFGTTIFNKLQNTFELR